MQSRPSVYWDAEPNALYTLLIEDLDILEEIGDVQFKHWIVTNIPGKTIQGGEGSRIWKWETWGGGLK